MEYHKEFKECPMCDCRGRVIEKEVELQKKEGKIAKDRIPASQIKMLPIIDPLVSHAISAPVLMVYYDICDTCGYEYPHIITRQVLPRHQIEQLLGTSIAAAK